jgi:histidine ammonia-lyase
MSGIGSTRRRSKRSRSSLCWGAASGSASRSRENVARTALLCRIIGLAQGGSGVSPEVLDHLIAMFNAGITPSFPRAARSGRPISGSAPIWRRSRSASASRSFGPPDAAAEALRAAGLAPVVLKRRMG